MVKIEDVFGEKFRRSLAPLKCLSLRNLFRVSATRATARRLSDEVGATSLAVKCHALPLNDRPVES